MSEDKPGAGVAGFSPPEKERRNMPKQRANDEVDVRRRHKTSIPGLNRRHVSSIRVYWDDQPPLDISKERLAGIFKALRLGFAEMEKGPVE